MRTIIRLQRKGPKNAPTWRFVVQGSYKKLKGKTIENLGYWVPRQMDQHGKSFILNKTRAKYWLAMGVTLGNKVQKFLGVWNMAPTPWASFGRLGFQPEEKDQEKAYIESVDQFFRNKNHFLRTKATLRAKARQAANENVYFRRIKFQERIKDYFDAENKDEFINEIIGQTEKETAADSVETRSQKFYLLKQLYEAVESNPSSMPTYKKELIYKKLNQIAEEGILTEKEFEGMQASMRSTEKLDLIEKAMLIKYHKNKENAFQKLEYLETLLNPIDKTEFVRRCREASELDTMLFEKLMNNFLEMNRNSTTPFTILDVEYFTKVFVAFETMPKMPSVKYLEQMETDDSKIYVPRIYPITPLPDFTSYDPNDWYDLREDSTNRVRRYTDINDRWCDLPLTEALKEKDKTETNEKVLDMVRESKNYKDAYKTFRPGYPAYRKGKILRKKEVRAKAKAEKEKAKTQ